MPLSPSREARVQVQRILSAAYNGTANGHPIAVMNIADGILDTAYAIDVAPLVASVTDLEAWRIVEAFRGADSLGDPYAMHKAVDAFLRARAILARSQEPQKESP